MEKLESNSIILFSEYKEVEDQIYYKDKIVLPAKTSFTIEVESYVYNKEIYNKGVVVKIEKCYEAFSDKTVPCTPSPESPFARQQKCPSFFSQICNLMSTNQDSLYALVLDSHNTLFYGDIIIKDVSCHTGTNEPPYFSFNLASCSSFIYKKEKHMPFISKEHKRILKLISEGLGYY